MNGIKWLLEVLETKVFVVIKGSEGNLVGKKTHFYLKRIYEPITLWHFVKDIPLLEIYKIIIKIKKS